MTDTAAALTYAPLFVMALLLLAFISLKTRNQPAGRHFVIPLVLLLLWLLAEMSTSVLKNPRQIEHAFALKLIIISLHSVAFFSMTVHFYRAGDRLPKWLLPALLALPAGTALLCLPGPLRELVGCDIAVGSAGEATVVLYSKNLWFWVNGAASRAPLVMALCLVFCRHRRIFSAGRVSAYFIVSGILAYFAALAAELAMPAGALSPSLIVLCVAAIFFYIVTGHSGRPDYFGIFQIEILEYIETVVFIMNRQGTVVDLNRPARALLQRLGLRPGHIGFEALISKMLATGRVSRRALVLDGGERVGEDLCIAEGKYSIVYSMCFWPILNDEDEEEGSAAILRDATRNRLLIDRLKSTAGVDELTGVANRYRYQQLLHRYDAPEFLPLSVVVGDVDSLKTVNDTFGHAMGDELLKTVASALQNSCPSGGTACRTGGDEFAVLLPGRGAEQAEEFMRAVRGALKEESGLPFEISLSLGSATKLDSAKNLNALLDSADMLMYSNKPEVGQK